MMMGAYNEIYLDDAMDNLGEAFDYVVNSCGMELGIFIERFIVSGIAGKFASGIPKYIAGLSGTEMAQEVMLSTGSRVMVDNYNNFECSPEYWCGWILAYYQWYSKRSYKNIMQYITADELMKLYPSLHEASEEKAVESIDKIIRRKSDITELQRLRKALGYSQKELSEKTGVAIRMIQQYEQRAKDINKASNTSIVALAKTLGCSAEELMEY